MKAAAIPKEKYSVSFQSRLGRTPWLKPYTDFVLPALAHRGARRLLVMSPAFVSDCLETIEELGIRGRETFFNAGGAEFSLVPCFNEHPLWVEALEKMVGGFGQPTAARARTLRVNGGASGEKPEGELRYPDRNGRRNGLNQDELGQCSLTASRALQTWQMKLEWLVSNLMTWSSPKPISAEPILNFWRGAKLLHPHGHARLDPAQRTNFAPGSSRRPSATD